MHTQFVAVRKCASLLFGLLILVGFYLASRYSYLLFHSLVELFSVVIAFTLFIVAWNSRRFVDNNYVLFIGSAYLFVGGLDLVHTLGYPGMEIFPGDDANLATQLWIAARYLQSLSFLVAPVFLRRKLKIGFVFGVYAFVCFLFLGAIFLNHFPVCFVKGVGLTVFKKLSESPRVNQEQDWD